MNIKDVKENYSLVQVLEQVQARLDERKSKGADLWYYSPFREEKTASFHVHAGRNIWFDFGQGLGGNIIDFGVEYLRSQYHNCDISSTLKWFETLSSFNPCPIVYSTKSNEPKTPFEILKIRDLRHPVLIKYLEERKINPVIAKGFLKEAVIRYLPTKQVWYGLAFQNDDGGYEFRNKYLKSSLGCKGPTTIVGKYSSNKIHLFEGFMDFLSIMTFKGLFQPPNDIMVLNSLSFLKNAQDIIQNLNPTQVFTWFDNDQAGNKATQTLEEWAHSQSIIINPMNQHYKNSKDVNAWLMRP